MKKLQMAKGLPRENQQRKSFIRRFFWLLAVIAIGLCTLMLAIASLINVIVKQTVSGQIVPEEDAAGIDADCILVLGAGVREDGTPSPMLADRLNTAVSLYRLGASSRILMSGDHRNDDYDEVGPMKAAAAAAGVPSGAVFLDHAGYSTYDSLYRAKEIFGAEKIVIVTQEYHLYRALYIAHALGLDAVGVAAPPKNDLGQLYRDLREWAARVKDFVYVMGKPEAEVMGKPVSLAGDGDMTNMR